MAYTGELRRTQMNPAKSQYYGSDGTGRDTYIYNTNGGFAPEKMATKIDPVSKYCTPLSYSLNKVEMPEIKFGRHHFVICGANEIASMQRRFRALLSFFDAIHDSLTSIFYRLLRYHQAETQRASGLHPLEASCVHE